MVRLPASCGDRRHKDPQPVCAVRGTIAIGVNENGKGNGVAMNSYEDDEEYEKLEDNQPKRAQRTKFRERANKDDTVAKRDKHSGKRSHRQKTIKDISWPDNDD